MSGNGLLEFFRDDHRECDRRWTDIEALVDDGNDAGANTAWVEFDTALRRHLDYEEKVMFPAFEAATGMTGGPTQMMRMEHQQMRGLLDQMAGTAEAGDFGKLLDLGDTLLMLIQQHNSKEEMMLYPMAEQALEGQWDEIKQQLEAMAA